MVSFGDKCMRFYLNEKTDDLFWSAVRQSNAATTKPAAESIGKRRSKL